MELDLMDYVVLISFLIKLFFTMSITYKNILNIQQNKKRKESIISIISVWSIFIALSIFDYRYFENKNDTAGATFWRPAIDKRIII